MINSVYKIPVKFLNSRDHIVMIFLALFYLADFPSLSLIKVEAFLGKPLSFIFFSMCSPSAHTCEGEVRAFRP